MFLGIDQSLNHTGVCLLDERDKLIYLATIEPKRVSAFQRLDLISSEIERLIAKYKPRSAAMEGYAYNATVGRFFELGEIGGCIKLILHRNKLDPVIVAPTQLKKFVTSNGNASKEAMFKHTKQKWNIEITDDNQCDAFGLAKVLKALEFGSIYRNELEVCAELQ